MTQPDPSFALFTAIFARLSQQGELIRNAKYAESGPNLFENYINFNSNQFTGGVVPTFKTFKFELNQRQKKFKEIASIFYCDLTPGTGPAGAKLHVYNNICMVSKKISENNKKFLTIEQFLQKLLDNE